MTRLILIVFCLLTIVSRAQPFKADFFNDMKWRMIGPHRGGRTVGAVGVPQQPNVFYIGVNNGGGLKRNHYGRGLKTIFDDQPTSLLRDVRVAAAKSKVFFCRRG